jgi:hypothetical protein
MPRPLIQLMSRLELRSGSSQIAAKITRVVGLYNRTFGALDWLVLLLSPLLVIMYTTVIPFISADSAADSLLSGSSGESLTSVQYRASSKSSEQTTETGLRVIGATQSFVFFYDRKETKTLIIPSAQIVEIEHQGPKDEPQEKEKKQ